MSAILSSTICSDLYRRQGVKRIRQQESSGSIAVGLSLSEAAKPFREERGVAITEFLVVFPFLLIMLAGVVDLGIALNRYYIINRVAYEATRYAASIPGLEDGTYADTASVVGASLVAPLKPAHLQLRARVDLLLARNGIDPAALPPDYLTTELATPTGLSRDQVSIRISIPFAALFPIVGDVLPSLSTKVSGPYLFPS